MIITDSEDSSHSQVSSVPRMRMVTTIVKLEASAGSKQGQKESNNVAIVVTFLQVSAVAEVVTL